MDKKEARKILGVTKETSRNDLERKFTILLKKHRMIKEHPASEEEAGVIAADDPARDSDKVQQPAAMQEEYSFEQITQAYNILMGYEVVIKGDPPSKAAPLLKKAGIDEKNARNFFYYYKFHILAAIVAVIFIFFTVKGCVNQVKPDFNIAFIGRIIYTDATDKLGSAIKAGVPEIKEPGFDGAYIAADDKTEQQSAMVMKATVLFAAGDVDLFILDKNNYLNYAKNGAFLILDEAAPKLGIDMEKNKDNIVATEETDMKTGKTTTTGDPHLYGVDITSSKALKDAGVIGTDFVAAIHVNDKNEARALELLQFLMK